MPSSGLRNGRLRATGLERPRTMPLQPGLGERTMGRPLGTQVLVLAAGLLAAIGCGSSRNTVEAAGQTTCTTCHGMPPATGAHLAHVDPTTSGSPAGVV